MYSPCGRSPKIAQPFGPVKPLKVPAPVPLSPTPSMPVLAALTIWIASDPLLAETDPFGGATRLWATTGSRLPIEGQVTVERISM